MQTRLLSTTAELVSIFGEWCAKADDIRIVTAWATMECLGCQQLAEASGAISTLVIGLDFYQTAPPFLESFRSNIRIGQAPGNAIFHPKVYLFRSGKSYCCILGSSNFTGGGFGDNVELNVSVMGKTAEPFFAQVVKFINAQEDLM